MSYTSLIEDKGAYQAKRLINILLTLVDYATKKNDLKNVYFKESELLTVIHDIASPHEIHSDDINYLTPSFVTRHLSATYTKLGVKAVTQKDIPHKMVVLGAFNHTLLNKAFKPLKLTEEATQKMDSKVVKQLVLSAKEDKVSSMKKALIAEIVNLLKQHESLTAEELRHKTYKSRNTDPEGYSRYYAKSNLVPILKELVMSNTINLTQEKAKKNLHT